MTGLWIVGMFFVFVLCGVVAAGYVLLIRKAETAGGPEFDAGTVFESVGGWVAESGRRNDSIRRQLAAAGHSEAPALSIYYGIKCATAVVLGVLVALVALIAQEDPAAMVLPGLCGAAFGYYFPARILAKQVNRRRLALQRALPTALDLCVLSLEAGQPLDLALIETSKGLRRSYPELAGELELAYLESRTVNDRSAALRALAERTGEPEVRKVVSLLMDADRFGISIAPALRNHSKYLRLRLKQNATEAARKVGVKLIFPVFFLIFPAVILITLGPACIMVFTQLGTLLNR